MRLHLMLTPNREPVPFDYQVNLVRTFHKWLGENKIHNSISLYSLSWLKGGKLSKGTLNFSMGANWFISSYDITLIKFLIKKIRIDPKVAFGMEIKDILIQETPNLQNQEIFKIASPILIKRTIGIKEKYYFYDDDESDHLMTETIVSKMKKAGLNDIDIEISFYKKYSNPKIKGMTYKGIHNKANTTIF